MTWIRPTSFTDAASAWSNEAYAYNDVTTTPGATVTLAADTTSDKVVLTPSANILATKVRVMCKGTQGTNLTVDAYYGAAWNNILNDTTITNDEYYEITFSSQTVENLRVALKNTSLTTADTKHILDVGFYGRYSASQGAVLDSVWGYVRRYNNISFLPWRARYIFK
jgi:hypothetical protein